jgi:hypothetical protein
MRKMPKLLGPRFSVQRDSIFLLIKQVDFLFYFILYILFSSLRKIGRISMQIEPNPYITTELPIVVPKLAV